MVCWCDAFFFRVFLCGLLVLELPSESLFFVAVNAPSVGFLLGHFFVEVLLIGVRNWTSGAAAGCARTFWNWLGSELELAKTVQYISGEFGNRPCFFYFLFLTLDKSEADTCTVQDDQPLATSHKNAWKGGNNK